MCIFKNKPQNQIQHQCPSPTPEVHWPEELSLACWCWTTHSSSIPLDRRLPCLSGHSTHRGSCGGTAGGNPLRSRKAWPPWSPWWWDRSPPPSEPGGRRERRNKRLAEPASELTAKVLWVQFQIRIKNIKQIGETFFAPPPPLTYVSEV